MTGNDGLGAADAGSLNSAYAQHFSNYAAAVGMSAQTRMCVLSLTLVLGGFALLFMGNPGQDGMLASAFATTLIGTLFDLFASYRVAFLLGAMMQILAILLILHLFPSSSSRKG